MILFLKCNFIGIGSAPAAMTVITAVLARIIIIVVVPAVVVAMAAVVTLEDDPAIANVVRVEMPILVRDGATAVIKIEDVLDREMFVLQIIIDQG